MCIRDSIGTEICLDRVDDDQSGVVLDNGFFNSFIGERQLHLAVINDPVSYTHLDVYKRQTAISAMRFSAALICAESSL